MPFFAPPDVGKLEAKKNVRGLIKVLVHEKSAQQRRAAAQALGNIGDSQADDPLFAALSDPEGAVSSAAAVALGRLGDARAVPALILTFEEQLGSFGAVKALGTIGVPAVEALGAALRSPNDFVRMQAAEALGLIGQSRAVELLIVALKDPAKIVRFMAAQSLGSIGDRGAVGALLGALEGPGWELRCAAAIALGKIRDPRAVEPLVTALEDKDWLVPPRTVELIGHPRARVAEALGAIGDFRAAPALTVALEDVDEDAQVRAAAAVALRAFELGWAPELAEEQPAGRVPAVALLCDAYISFDTDEALNGWAKQVLQSKWPGIELNAEAQIEAAMGFTGDPEAAKAELERLLKQAMATAGADREPYQARFFSSRSEMPPTKVWCMAAIKPQA